MLSTRDTCLRSLHEPRGHLHDLAYLRDQPWVAFADGTLGGQTDARISQDIPPAAIETLNAISRADTGLPSWRRYQLLCRHHVEADSPQSAPDQLTISRRRFCRVRTRPSGRSPYDDTRISLVRNRRKRLAMRMEGVGTSCARKPSALRGSTVISV